MKQIFLILIILSVLFTGCSKGRLESKYLGKWPPTTPQTLDSKRGEHRWVTKNHIIRYTYKLSPKDSTIKFIGYIEYYLRIEDSLYKHETVLLKYALFPMNIFSSEYAIGKYKETQNKVIRGISEYVSDDPKVDFVLSYKHLPGYTEKAKLLGDISGIGHSNFWARKSVFSSLEPDWEKVQAVGLKTNANWAVFIRANIAHSTPTIVDVYFYEFETKEFTIKTEETGKYSIAEVAIRMIKETLCEDDNKLRTR